MRDLEWYIDLKGSKTGPFAARDIVEMVKAGKVPESINVTADRLNGEWISARELVAAYRELAETPRSPWSADFNPPPRPTEQLEVASSAHYSEADQEYDPTASLFQAIRNLKSRAVPPTKTTRDSERESTGSFESGVRRNEPFLSPQAIIVSILGFLIFGAAYAMWQIVKSNSATVHTAESKTSTTEPAETPARTGLVDSHGKSVHSALTPNGTDGGAKKLPPAQLLSGSAPARTSAPVQSRNSPSRSDSRGAENSGGGAVYENELSQDTLAELQAAQAQDERSDPNFGRDPAAKRKQATTPPVPPQDIDPTLAPAAYDAGGAVEENNSADVAPDSN